MEKRNIRLTIAFDGSNYQGWQIQKDWPSVQGTIMRSLAVMLGESVHLHGAGRTDSGAHAFQYTANFHTLNRGFPLDKVAIALNSLLPKDIRILKATEESHSFHSQFSASAREYLYVCIDSPIMHPAMERFAYHLPQTTDVEKLRQVCAVFPGEHCFKSFCYGYGKNPEKNMTRQLFYFRVARHKNAILFFIKSSGFLRGMIRSIVSVCLNYAWDRLELSTIRKSLDHPETNLDSKHRTPVPAEGLYFRRAFYPGGDFNIQQRFISG